MYIGMVDKKNNRLNNATFYFTQQKKRLFFAPLYQTSRCLYNPRMERVNFPVGHASDGNLANKNE